MLVGQDDLCCLMYIPILGDDNGHKCDVEIYESEQGKNGGFRDRFTLQVK